MVARSSQADGEGRVTAIDPDRLELAGHDHRRHRHDRGGVVVVTLTAEPRAALEGLGAGQVADRVLGGRGDDGHRRLVRAR